MSVCLSFFVEYRIFGRGLLWILCGVAHVCSACMGATWISMACLGVVMACMGVLCGCALLRLVWDLFSCVELWKCFPSYFKIFKKLMGSKFKLDFWRILWGKLWNCVKIEWLESLWKSVRQIQFLCIFSSCEQLRDGGMYCASKREFYTSDLFEKQGTSEGSEWFQIDLKWPSSSLILIQTLQRSSVSQANNW